MIVMIETVFFNQYWKHYIMIEKEFNESIKYVAIDEINFSSYSAVYAKLLLQIGSEVDVVAKKLCREINTSSTANNINQYKSEICNKFPEFEHVTVKCITLDLNPWNGWTDCTPVWWKIYNGVKHERNGIFTFNDIEKEYYKFANQGNVLNALAGLYQLELYLYLMTDHNPSRETPLPGSRLFKLINQQWENKHFGDDVMIYVDNGTLYTDFAETLYSDI